ncbi:MAG: CvpA family protein, partial [Muribaculaceae bacterium]|nr:CvpA family protein [Muribaculaceae bacterium]
MGDAIFHIIAIAVAAWGVIVGYRRGLTGLVTSVLGMAFGVVCSHIFSEGVTLFLEDWVTSVFPHSAEYSGGRYLASNLGCGAIYVGVFVIFRSLTGIIRNAMDGFSSGLLNSLLGTIFCVANYLLILSICSLSLSHRAAPTSLRRRASAV